MDYLQLLQNTERQRVSDGERMAIMPQTLTRPLLVLILSQLGDFDSLEYAWWLQKDADLCRRVELDYVAVGIGDRRSGQKFCDYTGFPAEKLFMDPDAALHRDGVAEVFVGVVVVGRYLVEGSEEPSVPSMGDHGFA